MGSNTRAVVARPRAGSQAKDTTHTQQFAVGADEFLSYLLQNKTYKSFGNLIIEWKRKGGSTCTHQPNPSSTNFWTPLRSHWTALTSGRSVISVSSLSSLTLQVNLGISWFYIFPERNVYTSTSSGQVTDSRRVRRLGGTPGDQVLRPFWFRTKWQCKGCGIIKLKHNAFKSLFVFPSPLPLYLCVQSSGLKS